jgi:hypothetical protein
METPDSWVEERYLYIEEYSLLSHSNSEGCTLNSYKWKLFKSNVFVYSLQK